MKNQIGQVICYNYVLSFDPSGSFKKGKGTTGYCLMDCYDNKIIDCDEIYAGNFKTVHEYYEAHLKVIKNYLKIYGMQMAVSAENYILYESCAMAQVNSEMETVRLLGVIEQYCWQNAVPYYTRPAVVVKSRWTNEILVFKNIINKRGKSFYLPKKDTALSAHKLDSIRHATHFSTFENQPKDKYSSCTNEDVIINRTDPV